MKAIIFASLCNLALICGIAYKAYEHGFYVGSLAATQAPAPIDMPVNFVEQ